MRIYVGNLPYGTDENELEGIFGAHGQVSSVTIVRDRETGRSRGFGFVEFNEDSEGHAAIEALNEHDMGGRKLTVNEARPRTDRGGGGGGGGRRH